MSTDLALAAIAAAGAITLLPTGNKGEYKLTFQNQEVFDNFQNFTQGDVEALALNVYFEARGEGRAGWLAVLNVCKNRLNSGDFQSTYSEIVYAPKQFSWTADGLSDTPRDAELMQDIRNFVTEFLTRGMEDNTGGALFYHNPAVISPDRFQELFARPLTPTVNIGSHSFYA